MLHAPDFLGVPSAIELAEIDRPTVERALRLKKAGNRILEVIGGRAIHPVNVKVGGFHRLPRRDELKQLTVVLEEALVDAVAVTEWVAGFEFPDVEMEYRFMVADDPGQYPVMGSGFVIEGGSGRSDVSYAAGEFLEQVVETHVEHSTALHAHLRSGDGYLVGPLARFAMAADRLHPIAAQAAARACLDGPVRNPFRSIVVRAVEVVHAVATSLELIESLASAGSSGPPAVAVNPPAAGPTAGHGITEAPRGLLYHRYRIESGGDIAEATIIPPTSQNQPTIEHDLWHVAEDMIATGGDALTDEDLQHRCEVAIRNHDPCISCATHFLDLTVDRRDTV
jgi:coenzyme F420-reducing hydrogenase alpha subunit